jgi:hypothetical protein
LEAIQSWINRVKTQPLYLNLTQLNWI